MLNPLGNGLNAIWTSVSANPVPERSHQTICATARGHSNFSSWMAWTNEFELFDTDIVAHVYVVWCMVGTLATFWIVGPALTVQAHSGSGIVFLVAVVAISFSEPSASTTITAFLDEGIVARFAKVARKTFWF